MNIAHFFSAAVIAVVLLACDDPSRPESGSGTVSGRATGSVSIELVNERAEAIYVPDECCYPAALRVDSTALWSVGGHLCNTSTHNDPNRRARRVEPGATYVQTWDGIAYESSSDSQGECSQAVFVAPRTYTGRVCVWEREPTNTNSRAGGPDLCKTVSLPLPAAGNAVVRVPF